MTETTEKIDHHMVENRDTADGAPLGRTVTVTLSPEQYEKTFFQPSAPRRGDLAKRFANPTLLGLMGFLIPYTSTVLCLLGLRGAVAPYSLAGLSGDYYFLGSIAMVLAGVMEFILGNTFPFTVFIIYGCHWGSLAYTQDPIHQVTAAFESVGGAEGAAYNASQGFHNVTMVLVSFTFLICTFRVNALFTLTFFGLVMLFSFIAAADFSVASATTAADLEHISTLLRFAGGFGMIGAVCGWYLCIVTGCAAVGIPCPLPVFDLSSKIFPSKTDKGV
ncbi:hypothetical protein AAFC00_005702 [Neodothiora populina]|uniref:Uncharacterized protein n=1 Tax=Neodothiora populina TaxID=2781224 RepID=A0ABR3P5L5_9PEZI